MARRRWRSIGSGMRSGCAWFCCGLGRVWLRWRGFRCRLCLRCRLGSLWLRGVRAGLSFRRLLGLRLSGVPGFRVSGRLGLRRLGGGSFRSMGFGCGGLGGGLCADHQCQRPDGRHQHLPSPCRCAGKRHHGVLRSNRSRCAIGRIVSDCENRTSNVLSISCLQGDPGDFAAIAIIRGPTGVLRGIG